MSTSTFSKSDEYGFVRPDDFDYVEYEKFMSVYITILTKCSMRWSRLLASNPELKRNSQLKKFVRRGIPFSLRAQTWTSISGVQKLKDKYGPNTYKRMLNKPINEDIRNIITVDVPRTYPDNIYFHPNSENQKTLFRILCAFAACNPDVGYCQGLNYIAGLLLLVTKNEETCFWLLRVLVENKLPDYYSKTMDGVIVDIEVFSRLVKKKCPEVSQHMNDLEMPWALVATKWFICLFSEVLPIETTLRVWDCLFYEGSKVIFRVGLMLVKYYKKELLECEDIVSLAECFKSIIQRPFPLNCHLFIKQMFSDIGSLPMSLINDLRRQVSAERNADKPPYKNKKG
ncbi:growth hormone-regulated TBC protein 1 isoform X1 [Melanaphis sacchari]|uniref:Growth hormone-regulated TBC protein 1 n=1 Tax=Melanaphis sacchari TaxID=742174 RepID=A0A2H8TLZ7_9HEMI|nr:growth hormone-regulated TBC protein 1 isoform X1 [Melanaphis sacchari]